MEQARRRTGNAEIVDSVKLSPLAGRRFGSAGRSVFRGIFGRGSLKGTLGHPFSKKPNLSRWVRALETPDGVFGAAHGEGCSYKQGQWHRSRLSA